MERKLNETFESNGVLLKVARAEKNCWGCHYRKEGNCTSVKELTGYCTGSNRSDYAEVIFVKIDNLVE